MRPALSPGHLRLRQYVLHALYAATRTRLGCACQAMAFFVDRVGRQLLGVTTREMNEKAYSIGCADVFMAHWRIDVAKSILAIGAGRSLVGPTLGIVNVFAIGLDERLTLCAIQGNADMKFKGGTVGNRTSTGRDALIPGRKKSDSQGRPVQRNLPQSR